MKDSKLKYLELFQTFEFRANEIRISCKVSQRNCEILAKRVGAVRPKTPGEFEKVEELKAFIAATSDSNHKMVDMLDFVQKSLTEVASDCTDLLQVAELKDKLQFQSTTIEMLLNENQKITSLRDEIRRRNQATA